MEKPQNTSKLNEAQARLATFDHELAFVTEGVVGWHPPWEVGALESLRRAPGHLFSEQLRGKALDFDRLAGAWMAVADSRLAAYRHALPGEWNEAAETANKALRHIAAVRDNLDAALQEVMRVLK